MDDTNTEVAKPGLHSTASQPELLETKIIGIAGMTSDRCVQKIEKAFRKQPGIKEVVVDRENARATVTFDTRATNMAELHEVLLRSGYRTPATVVPTGV